MTIPVLPIPDTRPGYAFQQPGIGGEIAGGLQEVIQALLQRAQMDQRQQALGLQERGLEQEAAYRQAQLQQEDARRQMELMTAMQQRQDQTAIGNAIGGLTAPQQLSIPGEGIYNLPMPPQEPGQVLQGVEPRLREKVTATEPYKAALAGRKEAQATAKTEAARQAWLKSLSPELQPLGQAIVLSKQAGVAPEIGNLLMREALKGITPEAIAEIDRTHPRWKSLPPDEKIQLLVHEEEQRNEARFRPPPQGDNLANVPPSVVVAVRSNEKTIAALQAARADILANPKAIGWVNRIPGIADLADVAEAQQGKEGGGITRASVAGAGQLIIYDNTGKQVNMEELKRSRQIPTIKDPPSLAIQKIDRMIEMSQSSAEMLRNAYAPEFGFKPQIQRPVTPGTIPTDSTGKRKAMTGLTGTYKGTRPSGFGLDTSLTLKQDSGIKPVTPSSIPSGQPPFASRSQVPPGYQEETNRAIQAARDAVAAKELTQIEADSLLAQAAKRIRIRYGLP